MPDQNTPTTVPTKKPRKARRNQYVKAYPPEIVERVLDLHRQGLSASQIGQIPGLPESGTLAYWRHTKPDFAEDWDDSYSDYVRHNVETALALVPRLDRLRGLDDSILDLSERMLVTKTAWRRDAIHKHVNNALRHAGAVADMIDRRVGRSIQAASARLPKEWGRDTVGGGDTIVMEIGSLQPQPLYHAAGSPDGQPAQAAEAEKLWKQQQKG
jgi:hypothetical protein